jgi:4-amino-4-deoxy-L-arabinose transferase-like glycosyltransferase
MMSKIQRPEFIRRANFRWLIVVLFAALLASRLIHLGADPPVYLSPSGGLFGDESALAHNARNKVLFGEWMTDDWNPYFYNPILSILEYFSFSLLGVGLKQLRLVNVAAVFVSLLLLWAVLKKSSGKRIALLSIILLGGNYIFTMYGRLGLNDTFLILPMALTLFFWQKGLDKPKILFLAGVSSFACYISKASALFFILATLAALIFALWQKYTAEKSVKRAVSSLVWYLSGLGVSYVLWFVLFYSPHKMEFARISSSWFSLAMPSHLGRLWLNLTSLTFPGYMTNTAVELIIAWLYLPLIIYGLLRWRKKMQPMEIYLFLWLCGGYVALNGLSYRPLRYFVPLIPAVCLLCAIALNKIWDFGEQKKRKVSKAMFIRLFILGLPYAAWVIILLNRCVSLERVLKIGSPILGLAVLLTLLLLIIQKVQKNVLFRDRPAALKVFLRSAVVSIIAFVLYLNGSFYWSWLRTPKYTVMETSRELGQILDNAYIAGLWSPLATIENRHRCLYVGNNWFNYQETFDRYPVTHLFLWDGNDKEELRFFQRAYPQIMEQAEMVKIYSIKALPVRLFKINK